MATKKTVKKKATAKQATVNQVTFTLGPNTRTCRFWEEFIREVLEQDPRYVDFHIRALKVTDVGPR